MVSGGGNQNRVCVCKSFRSLVELWLRGEGALSGTVRSVLPFSSPVETVRDLHIKPPAWARHHGLYYRTLCRAASAVKTGHFTLPCASLRKCIFIMYTPEHRHLPLDQQQWIQSVAPWKSTWPTWTTATTFLQPPCDMCETPAASTCHQPITGW